MGRAPGALPAPDTRRRPRSSRRRAPAPAAEPEPSGAQEQRERPDKFPARQRAARVRRRAAAPGPRGLRASPRPSCAPGGDGGAPRRAAGGRPGDAEPPRRRDRRDRTGPPEVSVRGVRAGGRAPGAAGAGPGTPPRPPPRERPRRGAGSPSPVPAGPRRVGCQRQGTARPRPSGPGPPQPNLATRLAALAFPLGKRTRGACVSAGGDGAGGTATVRTRVKAGETERGVPSGCVGGCRTQGSRRDGRLWRKRLRVAPTPEGRALLSRRPLPSQGGERSGMPLGAQRCGRECGGSGQAPLAQAGPRRQRGDLSEFLGQRAVQRQARGLPGTIWERPDNP